MTSSISMNLRVAVAATLLAATAIASAEPFAWQTVANNKSCIPDDLKGRTFNSYGQPSVNASGLVVFRGRSTGAEGSGEPGVISSVCEKDVNAPSGGGPARGVYASDMNAALPELREVAAVGDPVPEPNNAENNEGLAPFNEFPAFPRVDIMSDAIATRGQSRPVWKYPIGDTNNDGVIETTKVGTSGIYVDRASANKMWATGASQLGAVTSKFDENGAVVPDPDMARFAVPVATGAAPNTKFDQFPGSPALMKGKMIAFKGNYTSDGQSYTGVFLRDVSANTPVQMIASSQGSYVEKGVLFGSTAPPSAAGDFVFFVGLDNEEAPTLGGIYRANLNAPTNFAPLVKIGKGVNGLPMKFNKIGESLSLSAQGRQVAFWAAWGAETVEVKLKCPTDGKLAGECLKSYPLDETTEDPADTIGYYPMTLPKNQGIFVYDTNLKSATTVATTGDGYGQFLYCIFSGKPANIGQGSEGSGSEDAGGGSDEGDGGANEEPGADGEPARWRCSSFAALSGMGTSWYQVAFKATKTSGETGVYLWDSANRSTQTVIKVGDSGTVLEPTYGDGLEVTAIGLERDGFRKGWLGITASMANADASVTMAGVYVTQVPGWDIPALNTLLQQLSTQ
jgi:hypothetical protein